MEKNIYDITMINEEQSEPLHVDGEFIFNNITTDYNMLKGLNSTIKRFDEGFIHVERVYNVEDKDSVLI